MLALHLTKLMWMTGITTSSTCLIQKKNSGSQWSSPTVRKLSEKNKIMQQKVVVETLKMYQSIGLRPVHHAGIKQNL